MTRTKRRGTPKGSAVNTTEQCCALCELSTNDPDQFGEMVTLQEHKLTVHYFCLLTSSGVYQKGEEDEGIFGFLVDDIKREIYRSSKLTCVVCKIKGASVGCCVKSCRKMVHFPCGKKHQFISQFTDRFQSYCKDHSPTQSIPVSSDLSLPHSCSVCLDTIDPVLSYSILKCPACHASWFHRDCVQHQAHSAGLFFFRCTLCSNKDRFQEEMLRMGVHIPERDASWELEESAFGDLLEVYQQCDALDCVCTNGRSHSAKTGWFEVLRCALCGSRGTHRKCSGLNLDSSSWACEDCTEAVDGKASLVPMVSPQRGGQRRSLLSKRRLSSIHSGVSCKRPSLSADSSPEDILQALALQLLSPQTPSTQASPEPSPQHQAPLSTLSRQTQAYPSTQASPEPSPQHQAPLSTLSTLSRQVEFLSSLSRLPSQPRLQEVSILPRTRISSVQHQLLISSYFPRRSSEPEPRPPSPLQPSSQADPLPSPPVLFCKPEPCPVSPLPSPGPQRSTRASRLQSHPGPQRSTRASRLQSQTPSPLPSPGPQRSTRASRLQSHPGPQRSTRASRLQSQTPSPLPSPGPQRSTRASRLQSHPAPQRSTRASRLQSSPGPQRSTRASRLQSHPVSPLPSPGPQRSTRASRLQSQTPSPLPSPAPQRSTRASRLQSQTPSPLPSPGPQRSTRASRLQSQTPSPLPSPGPQRSTRASRLHSFPGPQRSTRASRLHSFPGPQRSTRASRLHSFPGPQRSTRASRLQSQTPSPLPSPGPQRSTRASRLQSQTPSPLPSPGPQRSTRASRLQSQTPSPLPSPGPQRSTRASRLQPSPAPQRSTRASRLQSQTPSPLPSPAPQRSTRASRLQSQTPSPLPSPAPQRSTRASRLQSSPGPQRSTRASRLQSSPGPQRSTRASRLQSQTPSPLPSPAPQRSTRASRLQSSPGPQRSTRASRLQSQTPSPLPSPAPQRSTRASRLQSRPAPQRSTRASRLQSQTPSPLPSPAPQCSTRASRLQSRPVSQRQPLRQLQHQPQTPSPQSKITSPQPRRPTPPQLKTSTPQTHPSCRLQVLVPVPSSPVVVVVSGVQALGAGLALVRSGDFNPTHRLSVRFKDGHKLPFPSCPGGIAAKSYFLKLLVQQIQESVVFEGPPGAKNLALDSQALREDLYFEVGCLLALSLVHGGPALCFFSPALYQCLFNFPRDTPLSISHITPSHFSQRIYQIAEARSLEDLKETMEACREFLELAGCNWPITTLEDKQVLVEDLVSFIMITRLQLPLQRFREGLRTLGVFEQVQMFPAVFSRVFCGPAECLSAETLAGLFTVSLSERQDRRDRETPVLCFWRRLLAESEVGRSSISLQDILLFSTGGDAVPALGFRTPPSLAFLHPESPVQQQGRGGQGARGLGEEEEEDTCCPREKRRGGLRRRGREASPPAEEGGSDEEMEEGVSGGGLQKGLFPQSRPGSNQLSLPVVSSYLAFKSSMELPISHCSMAL